MAEEIRWSAGMRLGLPFGSGKARLRVELKRLLKTLLWKKPKTKNAKPTKQNKTNEQKKRPKIPILNPTFRQQQTSKKAPRFAEPWGTFPGIFGRRINSQTAKPIRDLGGFELTENSRGGGARVADAGTAPAFSPVEGEVSAPLPSVFMLLVLQGKVRMQQDRSRCPLYTFNATILFDY